jgi:hypothetical protein
MSTKAIINLKRANDDLQVRDEYNFYLVFFICEITD